MTEKVCVCRLFDDRGLENVGLCKIECFFCQVVGIHVDDDFGIKRDLLKGS